MGAERLEAARRRQGGWLDVRGTAVEVLEFALIVLACVIVSSVAGRIVRKVALPLVQIAVGFAAALVAPAVVEVQMPSDLFLVLFIAPLLFDEARRSDRRQLWQHKGAIASLAVGLVLATVVVAGFSLHLIMPVISLPAALACAAALAPTDAAAVSAMGCQVSLQPRQRTLLSGESLVNDASGVVAFQFAIAAAVTGAFSAMSAGEDFLVMFFGGIGVGAVLGLLALGTMRVLRHFGYEDTTIHVLYEVFTPFVVYLLAERLGVSGILAVVAAGLVMAERAPRLMSASAAKQQLVSDNFWRIIEFLINGIVFVMLGMQLPLAMTPGVAELYAVPHLLAAVLALTALIMACRLLWLWVMELLHVRRAHGMRLGRKMAGALRNALVMTLAGPKGAVTLSVIFTIPFMVENDAPFPARGLIIFLTAGVILATLLLANFLLPMLAPKKRNSTEEEELQQATVKVLEVTLQELHRRLDEGEPAEYVPAMRRTAARYQTRLVRQREAGGDCGKQLAELSQQCLQVQQRRADELQGAEDNQLSVGDSLPYYAALRGIRASVGYVGQAVNVGARFHSLHGWARLLWRRTKPFEVLDDQAAQVYYDSCLFAIELEHAAIAYLRDVAAKQPGSARAAQVLLASHQAALNSLWGRINYGQEVPQDTGTLPFELRPHQDLPEGMRPLFNDQLAMARRYANAVDSNALIVELDAVRHLEEAGEISESVARQLRQRVYALQAALEPSPS